MQRPAPWCAMAAPDPSLVEDLNRYKIRAAREMSAADKLAASGDLFDDVCERMRAGIRAQFPDADDEAIERVLRERLDIARKLENAS